MRTTLPLLFLLGFVACRSASPKNQTMEELFQSSAKDLSRAPGGVLDEKLQERQRERVDAARDAWLQRKLDTAEEVLWCAAVLGNSEDLEDVVLAKKLAGRADEMGDPRARTLEAEILDKELLKRGQPQRYGTQIVFDAFTRRYRMYDLDPTTTDAERRAVGLPPLAELMARVQATDRDAGSIVREERSTPYLDTWSADD